MSEFLPFILTEMNWQVYHNGGKLSKMNLVEYSILEGQQPKTLLFYVSTSPFWVDSFKAPINGEKCIYVTLDDVWIKLPNDDTLHDVRRHIFKTETEIAIR